MAGASEGQLLAKLTSYLREHPATKAIVTYSSDRLYRSMHDNTLMKLIEDGTLKVFIAREGTVLTKGGLPIGARRTGKNEVIAPVGYRMSGAAPTQVY